MAKYKSRVKGIIENIEQCTLQFNDLSDYDNNCWYVGLIDPNELPQGFTHTIKKCWNHYNATEVLDNLITQYRFCMISQVYDENQSAIYFYYGKR